MAPFWVLLCLTPCRCLSMAIRTQRPEIMAKVVGVITVNVIYLQRDWLAEPFGQAAGNASFVLLSEHNCSHRTPFQTFKRRVGQMFSVFLTLCFSHLTYMSKLCFCWLSSLLSYGHRFSNLFSCGYALGMPICTRTATVGARFFMNGGTLWTNFHSNSRCKRVFIPRFDSCRRDHQ